MLILTFDHCAGRKVTMHINVAYRVSGIIVCAFTIAVALIVLSDLHSSRERVLLQRLENAEVATYIDRWAGVGNTDFLNIPTEILAARSANIPVCYPEYVTDLSGTLHRSMSFAQSLAIQKPAFKVAENTQKLACTCKQCEPSSTHSFPPVCTECTCQEAEAHPEVFMLGHEKPCPERGCNSSDKAKNAMHEWPECERWACYNKDGWFCACTCPGESCPQPKGWF